MTEVTLEKAIKIKSSIDGLRARRKEIETLKEICSEEKPEEYVFVNARVAGWSKCDATLSVKAINHALDLEDKELDEEIRALSDELDKLH